MSLVSQVRSAPPVLSIGHTRGHPALLRGLNSLNVLTLLRESEALTGTQIAGAIGVSRTAVEAILADLIALGWLQRIMPEASAGLGRPAARYDLAPGVGCVGAIEFDSGRTAAAIVDARGSITASTERAQPEGLAGDARVAQGIEVFGEAVGRAGVTVEAVRCVGVASPGSIRDGLVTHFGGHGMPGWAGRDLRGELAASLGRPVALDGDSALGALAELRLGVGRGVDSFVYVYVGRRTGAALVLDGQVRRGVHGAVGLIGELPELRWCELEAAAYGEAPASDEASILALGISALVLAVDPATVVIGGPRRDALAPAMADIRAEVARRCPTVPPIELGTFGADAVLRGTACLAIDSLLGVLSAAVAEGRGLPAPAQVPGLVA